MPRGQSEEASSPKLFYKRSDFTKKGGLKRELDIKRLHDSIQHSWMDQMDGGSCSPPPTLDPIIVNSWKLLWSQPKAWIQFPESIMNVDDLDWGNCEKLSWSQNISKDMISRASIWIDDNHPILANFETLSTKSGAPKLDLKGNKDILKNHLLRRGWVWIVGRYHRKRVIKISRTEEFFDARAAHFSHGSRCRNCLLRNFCQRSPCTAMQMEKIPAHLRGKLGHLITMSQIAEARMKNTKSKNKTMERQIAGGAFGPAKFGPWLDFLVDSARAGDSRLSNAMQELEVARCFVSSLRLYALEDGADELRPRRIPEIGDVEFERVGELIQSLSGSGKSTWERRKEAVLNRLARRREIPTPTDWRTRGEKLYALQAFCPRTEAECALLFLLYRQEMEAAKEQLSGAGQSSSHDSRCPAVYQDTGFICRPGCKGCGISSSKQGNVRAKINTPIESQSTSHLGPLHALLQPAFATKLSIISEEDSQTTSSRIKQRSSKISLADTALSGQMSLQLLPCSSSAPPAANGTENLDFDHFITPPEGPTTPITAPEGLLAESPNGTTEAPIADVEKGRQGSGDSGYKSKDSSLSEDQIKDDLAAVGILDGLKNGPETAAVD
jgi:hypothetical protein